jgi:HAD superfamily hydrolase (TIGR01549 family)
MNKQKQHIQAVVFDFIGVLMGSASQQLRWAYVARQVGMNTTTLATYLQEGNASQQMLAAHISRQEWWAERMTALGVEPSQWERWHSYLFDSWAPNPECIELIEQLQDKGVRLALLSNGAGSSLGLKARYPFLNAFEALHLSGETGISKPYPAAFHGLEQALKLPPQALFFIDDAKGNVLAAQRAGWQGHHFKDVERLRLELEAWGLL